MRLTRFQIDDAGKAGGVPRRRWNGSSRGFTFVELIVAMTILMIMTAAVVPIVRVGIQRSKERELRRDLWEMRDAIDRYKDAADRGAFQVKPTAVAIRPTLRRWSKVSIRTARSCDFCGGFPSIL